MFKTHRTFDLTTGVKNKSIAVFNNLENTGELRVIYHKTTVFSYFVGDDEVMLRDGGYDTVSTRIVINQALSELGHSGILLERIKGTTMLNINGKREEWLGYKELILK
jgi:hypothetical protein